MANHLRTELVLDALEMAIERRQPHDVIHHSDQGCQYTSYAFGRRCREAGIRPSMGSVGDCYDNAMCESFFATLETELLDRRRLCERIALRKLIITGRRNLLWVGIRFFRGMPGGFPSSCEVGDTRCLTRCSRRPLGGVFGGTLLVAGDHGINALGSRSEELGGLLDGERIPGPLRSIASILVI